MLQYVEADDRIEWREVRIEFCGVSLDNSHVGIVLIAVSQKGGELAILFQGDDLVIACKQVRERAGPGAGIEDARAEERASSPQEPGVVVMSEVHSAQHLRLHRRTRIPVVGRRLQRRGV